MLNLVGGWVGERDLTAVISFQYKKQQVQIYANVKSDPLVYFMAGKPGVGKSENYLRTWLVGARGKNSPSQRCRL